ncbi:MAG TPA: TRAM domain-containing protein, partial [Noviherbaspirillum sp.]
LHLQATIEANAAKISAAMQDSVQRILVDGPAKKDAGELQGRTENNRTVVFPGGPNAARLIGQMLDVRITHTSPYSLRGELVLAH